MMKHLEKDIDWTLFEWLEGNLSPDESEYVQQKVNTDNTWNQAYQHWKLSYLESETIPYPNKATLKKRHFPFQIHRSFQWLVAASLLFIATWFFGQDTQNRRQPIVVTNIDSPVQNLSSTPRTSSRFGSQKSSETSLEVATTLKTSSKPISPKSTQTPQPQNASTQNLNNLSLSQSSQVNSGVSPIPPKEIRATGVSEPLNSIARIFFSREEGNALNIEYTEFPSIETAHAASKNTKKKEFVVTSFFIDEAYFKTDTLTTPGLKEIWQRTLKGELPAVQLAFETQPNSWIPSMNFNLSY